MFCAAKLQRIFYMCKFLTKKATPQDRSFSKNNKLLLNLRA